jgi:adenylyltransferase/sulfurtransferase
MPQTPLLAQAPIADSDRYSRQILFPGIGPEGQQRLARAHAAIVGVGATGAATASLLARAGVGRLTLIDRDIVEPSNLQRQVLFDEADAAAAAPKAEAARAKIAQFNSAIHVEACIADLVPSNIESLLAGASLFLDCTDNFETRYLLNDHAVQQGKPWIYAGAIAAQAATMTILPASSKRDIRHAERSEEPLHFDPANTASACLACLFPTPPAGPTETCDTAGILGAAVNLAASLQTAEALKILAGHPELLRRTFLSVDLWTNSTPPSPTRTARCAITGDSHTWPAPPVRTSRCAAATPCRFMSIAGPSRSPTCRGACSLTPTSPNSAPTRCCSGFAAARTR